MESDDVLATERLGGNIVLDIFIVIREFYESIGVTWIVVNVGMRTLCVKLRCGGGRLDAECW